MNINIICEDNLKAHNIKKKTNQYLGTVDKEWVNQRYLFDRGILYRLFDHGISLDSLYDSDGMYASISRYIESVFADKKIAVYGTYKWDILSQLRRVTITEI